MSEKELKEKLNELGFVSQPDLSGNPDFANFGAKLALCFSSRENYQGLELDERIKFNLGFRQRFADLRLKHWECRMIYKEDSLQETVDRLNAIMVQRETAKIHTPKGPEPTYEKLIKLLKQTDEELTSEEKRSRRRRYVIWGLEERRKNIERHLHLVLKPVILKRDNQRCRACGSTENLELARLSGGDMAKPERITRKRMVWHYPDAEKRYAEENMLILCEKCHKQLDSFNARFWRIGLGKVSIDEAVELLNNGKLKETAPIIEANIERLALLNKCSFVKSFFKALSKTVIFYKKGNLKKSRLHLGRVKRDWSFFEKEAVLPKELMAKVENLLQKIYFLNTIDEMEKAEKAIREYILEYLEKSLLPEVFSPFKYALLKQDKELSTI